MSSLRRVAGVLAVGTALLAGVTGPVSGRWAGEVAQAEPSPATTTRPKLVHTKGMYRERYCEILLVHPGPGGLVADVYNTYTLNECPAAPWAALDAKAVAQEQQVPIALRNGPRHWLMDRVDKEPLADPIHADFGGIEMVKLATVALGSAVNPAPYTEHEVDRRTVFTFAKGRTVHELVAPDGTTYVMQTWSQQVDPSLGERDLGGLGSRLQLPDGWAYRSRRLRAPCASSPSTLPRTCSRTT